jgi:hypothetical protein
MFVLYSLSQNDSAPRSIKNVGLITLSSAQRPAVECVVLLAQVDSLLRTNSSAATALCALIGVDVIDIALRNC